MGGHTGKPSRQGKTILNLFIGYDEQEAVAYHVLAHSIIRQATSPISITPLCRDHFRAFFTRERGLLESTDFSISRFLVPYLSGYRGYSIYMDCDMVFKTDVTQIWHEIKSIGHPAVWVAQHDYTPKTNVKMDHRPQTSYGRKNWSSFILFDNHRCHNLTPDYVNTATGLQLHRFAWLRDEDLGTLGLDWNWLVEEYPENPNAKVLHYTLGGPWFPDHRKTPHAQDWLDEYQRMTGKPYG